MNKKGDLFENVGETLIAVIGLVIIFVFVGWAIWSVYINQAERNAQKTIDSLEGRVRLLEEGQFGKAVIRKIPGWFIAGWRVSETSRPDKCSFKSCICICEGDNVNLYTAKEKLAEMCTTNGFCRFFEQRNASAFTIYSYSLNPFFNNQQDISNFLKDPSGYNGAFWQKFTLKSEQGEYRSTTYYDFILFSEGAQLEELEVYSDKEKVALLKINSLTGTAVTSGYPSGGGI